ncbi:strigolactones hydrolase CXE15-like [Typha angustifolia]|uniref:strigolactones hydrolase CXE15-like n=1 Tax=Typha angustifolia TaxID=59011 RepID=UPI003C2D9EFD
MTTISSSSAADVSTLPLPPSRPHVIEDCRGTILLYSDGTVLRSPEPFIHVSTAHDAEAEVDWRDVLYDPAHDLSLRLFKPRVINADEGKIPLLVYYHGGGFCLGSRTWPNFHSCCLRLASSLHVIVASVDYRLAPEHKLPAAIQDGAASLLFLRDQWASDAWLAEHADPARVFLSGESAGGNITHHMAVQFGPTGLNPIRIRGSILLMPAFGGVERTKSELECDKDSFLSLEQADQYCRLMLPRGATRDYPVFNPAGPEGPNLEAVETGPMLLVVAEKDMLKDREVEYARRMREEWGKHVEVAEFEGQQHGFFAIDSWSEPADEVIRIMKQFMDEFGRD